ncbi:hypothetical protein FACS1894122_04110 [Alphaproteobacteria bacterium]|nr:hypothetical protein FACS1894122_04110 [Alphaproteobacteria bacterium]
MKKFIAVAFSYVIHGCGSVYAVDSSCQDPRIEQMRVAREDELQKFAREICGQTDSVQTDFEIACGNSKKTETIGKLIETVLDIQEKIYFFGRDIPIIEQAKLITSVRNVLNLAYGWRGLCKKYPPEEHATHEQLVVDYLKRGIKELNGLAKAFSEQKVSVLPSSILPKEAKRAKELYQRISNLNSYDIERLIMNSKDLIMQFFCSTERFKEILLGTGNSITRNEQDNLKLLQHNIAKQDSYEGVLSIVGYPVFVLGIRSFMSYLVRVCEKHGAARDAGATNELRDIFRDGTRYVKQDPPPVEEDKLRELAKQIGSDLEGAKKAVEAAALVATAVAELRKALQEKAPSEKAQERRKALSEKAQELLHLLSEVPPEVQPIVFANGVMYKGEHIYVGEQNSRGILMGMDESYYEGDVGKDLEPHGKGIMILPTGLKYEGEFVNGKKSGEGILWYANGNNFQGKFKDDEIYDGIRNLPNGKSEQGRFIDGKLNGKGNIQYPNGDWYVGNILEGLPHGKGWKNIGEDKTYFGEWEHAKKRKGILMYSNGDFDVGDFKNDKMQVGISCTISGDNKLKFDYVEISEDGVVEDGVVEDGKVKMWVISKSLLSQIAGKTGESKAQKTDKAITAAKAILSDIFQEEATPSNDIIQKKNEKVYSELQRADRIMIDNFRCR